jgi:hypothetical protein
VGIKSIRGFRSAKKGLITGSFVIAVRSRLKRNLGAQLDKPFPTSSEEQAGAERVIKNLLLEVALKAALTQICVEIPALGLPVIRQLFFFLSTKLVEVVYDHLEQAVNFAIIDVKVDGKHRDYEAAVSKLREALIKNEEIDKAQEEFKSRLRSLIHFDGV